MERSIIITKDGSHSISVPGMNVTYHSHHGAIQESLHVFIRAGLHAIRDRHFPVIRILEMGFGTGLNALLTLIEAESLDQNIHYSAVELFPLQKNELAQLNYCNQLKRQDLQPVFEQLHQCEWEKDTPITSHFTLKKIQTNFVGLAMDQPVHLVYFDAFGPTAQPELWTTAVFRIMITLMQPESVLVTYCSKSDVRRAMRAAGFIVEKLPGPRGKREMVRAIRA